MKKCKKKVYDAECYECKDMIKCLDGHTGYSKQELEKLKAKQQD